MQAVLGVLGCPNLPQQQVQDKDGAAGVAERVGDEGIGCLFTAVKGQGAFVGPLRGTQGDVVGLCEASCCSAAAAGQQTHPSISMQSRFLVA